jgi:hypothetical protein
MGTPDRSTRVPDPRSGCLRGKRHADAQPLPPAESQARPPAAKQLPLVRMIPRVNRSRQRLRRRRPALRAHPLRGAPTSSSYLIRRYDAAVPAWDSGVGRRRGAVGGDPRMARMRPAPAANASGTWREGSEVRELRVRSKTNPRHPRNPRIKRTRGYEPERDSSAQVSRLERARP